MTPDHAARADHVRCPRLGRCAGSQPRRPARTYERSHDPPRPDGSGVDIVGHVGLAHRRLAIIDVHGAKQPMRGLEACASASTVRSTTLEPYDVSRRPRHEFTLNSDTEVLAHAAAQWGPTARQAQRHVRRGRGRRRARGGLGGARPNGSETALRRQRRFGPGPCVGFHQRAQSLSRRGPRPQPL